MAVQIFIARHGQNEDNANGILNGHRDLPLTETGREQATALGEAIKDLELTFDAIYSSPLSRAFDTAKTVSNILNMHTSPVILPELIERDFGVMTGLPISQIIPLCSPDIIQADPITYFLKPEGAETFPQLVERGHQVLRLIRNSHHEGNILLVCHGDLGKMIYTAATGNEWRDVLVNFHFGNGELIELDGHAQAHVITLPQYNA